MSSRLHCYNLRDLTPTKKSYACLKDSLSKAFEDKGKNKYYAPKTTSHKRKSAKKSSSKKKLKSGNTKISGFSKDLRSISRKLVKSFSRPKSFLEPSSKNLIPEEETPEK